MFQLCDLAGQTPSANTPKSAGLGVVGLRGVRGVLYAISLMFAARGCLMLISMSEIERRADMPPLDWSDLGVSELLPTGTVTLLLADVEGSTRLWQTQPEQMTAAVARLDRTLADVVAAHGGVRPVEQGEGDSFVVAFGRAGDAVACALALQRAPLAPIRLRIGVHTGDVQLRDEGNYIGPTINRTARLRDLAHGGQTVLSATTSGLVIDQLPSDAWLTDLGLNPLRDLPRPERVAQLCHPDLRNEFPPLRTPKTVAAPNVPTQLTSFVGRDHEMSEVLRILAANRLVTLTGAGGVGKTRLAIQAAAQIASELRDGVRYVDFAPISDPDIVPITVARALGLPDQPGRSTMDTLTRFIGERQMLIVLDNCEHLLDASAVLINALLSACPGLTLLATSREPIAVSGEVTWRVPSLSLTDEAIELFADRARRARPDFSVTDDNTPAVTEICRRLDGMPLAIELAAARVRALSLAEIIDSLHDRFRLLTGGARTAVRRQQTLRASVDWSHMLLTAPERILFRRLAVFIGGFDLDAARAVGGSGDIERYQVLDQLALLVDKSLVVAEDSPRGTRYRLLETVRQYALEKLAESGEADTIRAHHCDHYTAIAAQLDTPAQAGHERRLEQVETEIDNLRAALTWSRENSDIEAALALASSLQPLWLTRGRIREGCAWFDNVLTDDDSHNLDVAAAARARALADKALLDAWLGSTDSMDKAEQALALARNLDDPPLLARVLTACGFIAGYNAEVAQPYLAEAIGIARAIGDQWRLSQLLQRQPYAAIIAGDPITARVAAEEGRDFAEAIGDRFGSRQCRLWLGWAQLWQGDLLAAAAEFAEVVAEADTAQDAISSVIGLAGRGWSLAYQGDAAAARAAADAAIEAGAELGQLYEGIGYGALATATLAAGDVAAAQESSLAALQHMRSAQPETAVFYAATVAEAATACGDLAAARRLGDEAVSGTTATPFQATLALAARARVAIAQREPATAERDAYDALAQAARVGAYLGVPDILDCLAELAGQADSHQEAARLLGAAQAIRERTCAVRFKLYDAGYEASVMALRNAMGDNDFATAWAEGVTLSTEEAIAYAQRGHGERKRPTSGWASLTPAEVDVVRLVTEGLPNKDIAARLFVSPRTVQTHLTHVYTKLGLTSRMQLAQEAARHA
jgi:predicted ATPase/class 3 adenylate cyclase/DNA-binding NarL/FixJ family response regulator